MSIKLEISLNKRSVIVGAILAIAVGGGGYLLLSDQSPLKGEVEIEPDCSINGLGRGTCLFHNSGKRTGSICITLAVQNTALDKDVGSTRVCSGNLKPGDVSQISYVITGMDGCRSPTNPAHRDWKIWCDLRRR